MASISLFDLQPVFEHVGDSIRPNSPTVQCPVATVVYWSVRIDGEIGNGGVAQLIWNLHDDYDPEVLCDALRTIGADDAAALVQSGFDYVGETPTRKARFFAKGPFGPAKPLVALTERYDDLVPSVASLVGAHAEANWESPSFQAVLTAAGVGDLRDAAVSELAIRMAIDEADGDTLLGFVESGLDPNTRDGHDMSLIDLLLRRTDKESARVEIIERLVAAGADIESQQPDGDTALTASMSYGGQPAYIRCLIDLGADIEHVGNLGRTAVFGAVKKPESLRLLIDAGAVLDHVASNGSRPLGFALADYGRWLTDLDNRFRVEKMAEVRESIDLLLAHDAPLSESVITQRRPSGPTTELSAIAGDAALLADVVASPSFAASPEATGTTGAWTALHEASRLGASDSIRLLFEAGAAASPALGASDLERGVFAGATPIDVAIDAAMSELLATYGSEAGVRRSHDVHVTSRGEQPEVMASLFVAHSGLHAVDAAHAVASLPPEEGTAVDWDENDDLIVYSPALLAACADRSAADDLATRVVELGATVVVI